MESMTPKIPVYLIGSLRNPTVAQIGNQLRETYDVFDDWIAAGPNADDCWRDYEKARGNTFREALCGKAARHIFEFDKYHLDRCKAGVLVLPAGRSGHLELGYLIGRGKPGFILLDDPERWDVMVQFGIVCETVEEVVTGIKDWFDGPHA